MKKFFNLMFLILFLCSCNDKTEQNKFAKIDSEKVDSKPKQANEIKLKNEKLVISTLKLVGEALTKRLIVELEVKNQTDDIVEICKYQSPFEGDLKSGLSFKVLNDSGEVIPYKGMLVKRKPPDQQSGDYLMLRPGDIVKASVDLSKSYNFHKGNYSIKFIETEMNKIPSSNTITVTIK